MSGSNFVPDISQLLPGSEFNALLCKMGVRVAWMRARTCPCIYGAGGVNGALPFPGTADPACKQCFGIGTYWDPPTLPTILGMTFVAIEPTSAEPGSHSDPKFGGIVTADPVLTIPSHNPYIPDNDPAQPGPIWEDASIGDFFVSVDKLSRYVAVLQVGGNMLLPYQQNLHVAPAGAVSVYDSVTHIVSHPGYTVSGAAVSIADFPQDTAYMVEFQAAPVYVAFRKAGGLAHVRDFGGGREALPRRFRMQTLDLWTRQNIAQAQAAGSVNVGGTAIAVGSLIGTAVVG